ncbi:MAG: InlB B-repeat-containing protein [Methanocorpusculum sp.]|nr:InlB B-repeat-containing protein [Methanocorpusculum sp.]
MKKHILLAVAVVLLCVLMAGVVSATDTTYHEAYTVTDLTTNLSAGNNVRLMNDLTFIFSNGVNQSTIPNGKDVILDLNGRTISTTQNTADSPPLITIGKSKTESGSLTVTGNGKITATRADPTNLNQWTYLFFVKSGTLTIENGEYYSYGPVVGTNGHSDNNKGSKDAKIIINGGTYKSPDDTVFYLPGENTSLIMNNGEIIGDKGGVEIRSGSVTLNGGSITANGEEPESLQAESGVTSNTGAAIALTWMENYQEPTKVTINGGTINSKNGTAILNFVQSGSSNDMYSVSISGGTIEGKKAIFKKYGEENKDITPSITGGTFIVHTFADLKTCLEAGANVKLGEDITHDFGTSDETERIAISSGTPTLDLNGHALSATTSKDERSFIKINVPSGETKAKLTVTGSGSISVSGTQSARPYLFFVGRNGDLLIESGTYESSAFLISGNGNTDPSYASPNITINGGTFTSGATAIYMPADDGKLTINGGTITSEASGIDVRAGTITLNDGTLTAQGNQTIDWTKGTAQPLSDGSAIILASVQGSYSGQIAVKISGTANIVSENAAAITNYVRTGDGKTSNPSVSVTIEGDAKLSGKEATLENNERTSEKPVVGEFYLNGGYYKFIGTTGVLLKDVAPEYDEGYAMSAEPVMDGYYAPTKTTAPEVKEEVTPSDDGTVEITPSAGSSLTVNDKTVTLTAEGTSGSSDSVVLKVTYADDATVTTTGASGKVASVQAEYKAIPLEDTTGVTSPKVDMIIALTTVDTNLPTITGELGEAKQTALQKFGNAYTTFKMGPAFVASHEKLTEFNNNISTIILTFLVPKSWAPVSGNIGVVHISDDTSPAATTNGITITTTDNGDGNWKVTVTSTKGFSGYSVYYGASSPASVSSGDGNMNNAFRVLFNDGSSTVSVVTGLSYGDKITAPANPVKDGYTFAGWYKDSACTQSWSFSDGISGDMTLYAKWTGGSSSSQSSSSQQSGTTTQSTAKATPASTQAQSGTTATTAAPVSTTAAGVTPTLTQAPAPVAGLLFGLLIAGVFLRRRE